MKNKVWILIGVAILAVGALFLRLAPKGDDDFMKSFFATVIDPVKNEEIGSIMENAMSSSDATFDMWTTDAYGSYFTEQGLKQFLAARGFAPYLKFTKAMNIQSFTITALEQVSTSTSDGKDFSKYEVSYTYVDGDGKEYAFTDLWHMSMENDRLTMAKVDAQSDIFQN